MADPSTCAVCSAPRPGVDADTLTDFPWMCAACADERREIVPVRSVGTIDVLRPVGRGAMGVVYEGRERRTGHRAAVKILHKSLVVRRDVKARFVREQQTVAALEHACIARCIDVGVEAQRLYIASEFIDGGDATALLGGRGEVRELVRVGVDLFDGLQFIHDSGFVHRDIKPANVLLYAQDGERRAKITDFGLVGFLEREGVTALTEEGAVGGTASYMAPEQFIDFRHATESADIYSAAATLYHLLAGKTPLPKQAEDTRQYDLLISAAEDDRVPLAQRRADVSASLARLLDGLVMRSDAVRTAMSAGDIAEALRGEL